ncbi:glutaminase A [Roseococcus sp. DSY-14]|uniref:glutaminase A n=1 Tax=Roseococcus sp. DSY-14 TaxID=3369650 RepID=UPI00387AA4D3
MEADPRSYVSTGSLPPAERVQAAVEEAHRRFATLDDGAVSAVYPALERVDPGLWGLCVATADGRSFAAGDAGHPFTIMSVSKPFVFALVCAAIGPAVLREKVGVNATGYAFNSVAGVERSPDGRTNPMVNAGAIATTSLVPGADAAAKWRFLHEGLSRFAGRSLPMNGEVLDSARRTNHRNRALASFLRSVGAIYAEPMEAVDLYTMQCSLDVTARDLAVMGATLADGGVNPLTGERVVSPADCHHALAVMTIAGMYETSGDWLYEVGLPGKSGIGGGIVTVAPGKGALGTFSPRLDAAGNSVRGQAAARHLSVALGLDILASEPVGASA